MGKVSFLVALHILDPIGKISVDNEAAYHKACEDACRSVGWSLEEFDRVSILVYAKQMPYENYGLN